MDELVDGFRHTGEREVSLYFGEQLLNNPTDILLSDQPQAPKILIEPNQRSHHCITHCTTTTIHTTIHTNRIVPHEHELLADPRNCLPQPPSIEQAGCDFEEDALHAAGYCLGCVAVE